MGTTVSAVHEHLEEDPALVDTLVRDILGLRRTARWLIEKRGWDTSEEAVVSALRRYREDQAGESIWKARRGFHEAQLDVRSGLALVTLPRVPEAQEEAIRTWIETNRTGPFSLLWGRTRTRLLIEKRSVRDLSRELDPRSVEEVAAPVSAIRLTFPSNHPQVPLLTLGLTTLAHQGLEALEVVSCSPEWVLVVQATDGLEAHDILSSLTRKPESGTSP